MCCGNSPFIPGQPEKKLLGNNICRVCELVDGDQSIKPVTYCPTCSHWICDECMPEIYKRGLAAAIEFGQKFRHLFKK